MNYLFFQSNILGYNQLIYIWTSDKFPSSIIRKECSGHGIKNEIFFNTSGKQNFLCYNRNRQLKKTISRKRKKS